MKEFINTILNRFPVDVPMPDLLLRAVTDNMTQRLMRLIFAGDVSRIIAWKYKPKTKQKAAIVWQTSKSNRTFPFPELPSRLYFLSEGLPDVYSDRAFLRSVDDIYVAPLFNRWIDKTTTALKNGQTMRQYFIQYGLKAQFNDVVSHNYGPYAFNQFLENTVRGDWTYDANHVENEWLDIATNWSSNDVRTNFAENFAKTKNITSVKHDYKWDDLIMTMLFDSVADAVRFNKIDTLMLDAYETKDNNGIVLKTEPIPPINNSLVVITDATATRTGNAVYLKGHITLAHRIDIIASTAAAIVEMDTLISDYFSEYIAMHISKMLDKIFSKAFKSDDHRTDLPVFAMKPVSLLTGVAQLEPLSYDNTW